MDVEGQSVYGEGEGLEDSESRAEGNWDVKHTPESLDAVESDGGDLDRDRESASRHADDITHVPTLQKALDQVYDGQTRKLLFCKPASASHLDMTGLHPAPGQIFQLWQVYLDNVDPLLKVTHTPTMQSRIINAMTNLTAANSIMHAMLFAIYCVAVTSLSNEDCVLRCGSPKKELLAAYQLACQQAIWRCHFMRTNDRDTLTAVLLYLISIKSDVDRRSLSAFLGSVVRIAQRIGIDSETQNAKCNAFEAEMRRRLWWAIVLFDRRLCEASHDLRMSALTPTWTCQLPANLSDFDLRPGMKTLPQAHERPTEALHILVRSTIGQWLRYNASQIDFVNPLLQPLASSVATEPAEARDEFAVLEKLIAAKFGSVSNLDDPLHYATTWSARSAVASAKLRKHYWIMLRSDGRRMEAQRDAAMSHALTIVECEAKLVNSSMAERFHWYVGQFPFAAYIHVVQDLKIRPKQRQAEHAWSVLNDDFMSRFGGVGISGHPVFILLAKTFVQAWEAWRLSTSSSDERLTALPMIEEMRKIAESGVPPAALNPLMETPGGESDNPLYDVGLEEFLPLPADYYGGDAGGVHDMSWPDAVGTTANNMDWLGFGGPDHGYGFAGVGSSQP
ncbi:hypothetical protein LTR86_006872 [Recurvomyces mirabilis]|nr:hypothetical protein LTR86_006872 [Recurvomyces mirabilis]